jgi:hypothetical protein
VKRFVRLAERYVGCSNPDNHMGFYDPCGVCEHCSAPDRIAAIEHMVGAAIIQDPTLDEWLLRQRAADFYDKGLVRTPKKPLLKKVS